LVKVVPKGEYKINLEYPHKISLQGPAGASPSALKLSTKEARAFSKAELVFAPSFKVSTPGEHRFSGLIAFSVCTERQCEVKREKVEWVAKVVP
jgi:hypothetical protein